MLPRSRAFQLLALATWLSPTQYQTFAAAAIVVHHLKLSLKTKVKEINSENVAKRFKLIAQGLDQG